MYQQKQSQMVIATEYGFLNTWTNAGHSNYQVTSAPASKCGSKIKFINLIKIIK